MDMPSLTGFVVCIKQHYEGLAALVGTAAMLAAGIASKWDNPIMNFIGKILHFLAFNFGKAANAADAKGK